MRACLGWVRQAGGNRQDRTLEQSDVLVQGGGQARHYGGQARQLVVCGEVALLVSCDACRISRQ